MPRRPADESLTRHLIKGPYVEGGSDRSEASPTAILQDTHSVEGEFFRTSPRDGVLKKLAVLLGMGRGAQCLRYDHPLG
jgi:hypothetical protein